MESRTKGTRFKFLWALLVFISSYFPLAIIIIIKDLNVTCHSVFEHPRAVAAILLVTAFAVFVTWRTAHSFQQGGLPVKITKKSYKSGDLFTYTIPYMISFYKFELNDGKMVACFLVFIALMFALAYRTQNLLVNPVLALCGYHLWDCQFQEGKRDYSALLLSKEEFQIGDECVVEPMTHFLYFVISVTPRDNT